MEALAAAEDGDEIVLAAGNYSYTPTTTGDEAFSVTKAITVRGATGNPEDVIVSLDRTGAPTPAEQRAHRVFFLDNPGALVASLTMEGGFSKRGRGANFLISSGGGVISNCISRNSKPAGEGMNYGGGGALLAGLVTHCVISNNTLSTANFGSADAQIGGTGLFMTGGVCANSLITENIDNLYSGNPVSGAVMLASGSPVLINCTIVRNRGRQCAGVNARAGSVINCVIAENTTTYVGALATQYCVWAGNAALFQNCVADKNVAINATCLAAASAQFVDSAAGDFRLKLSSPARDFGVADARAGNVDFAGAPRTFGSAIDAGCYEFAAENPAIGIRANLANVLAGTDVTFSAISAGIDGATEYSWDIDNDGVSDAITQSATFTTNISQAGTYFASVTIPGGLSDTLRVPVKVFPRRVWVDANCATSSAPYDSENSAATTLSEALEWALDGNEICVKPGVYTIEAQGSAQFSCYEHALGTATHLHGTSDDPAAAIIRAVKYNNKTAPQKYGIVRPLRVNNSGALVNNLTFEGGVAEESGNDKNGAGAGLHIGTDGGTVSNCIVRGNTHENYAAYGGGVGMRAGLLTHCVITNNILKGNGGSSEAGGMGVFIAGGVCANSLIAQNSCTASGSERYGAVRVASGSLVNCTIANNSALKQCSGVYAANTSANVVNCVIGGNTTANETDPINYRVWGSANAARFFNCAVDNGVDINSSCVSASTIGFYDLNGNAPEEGAPPPFSLAPGSIALDAGTFNANSGETDLLGNPRVVAANVGGEAIIDCGCYEFDPSGAEFSAVIIANGEPNALSELEISFTAVTVGATGGITYDWDFYGDGTPDIVGSTESEVSVTMDIPGEYYPCVKVTDSSDPENPVIAVTSSPIKIYPRKVFVTTENPNATAPFDSAEKAATNLTDALYWAYDGNEIALEKGTYFLRPANVDGAACYEYPLVTATYLHGASDDPAETVISVARISTSLGKYHVSRALRVNNSGALVAGLTLENGVANESDDDHNGWGATLQIGSNGGTVSNCIVRNGLHAGYHCFSGGVALYGGLLTHCTITNNQNRQSGNSGMSVGSGLCLRAGVAANCLIAFNDDDTNGTQLGAGEAVYVSGGTLVNCTIVGNNTRRRTCAGVNVASGAAINCAILGNKSLAAGAENANWAIAGTPTCFRYCAYDSDKDSTIALASLGEGCFQTSLPAADFRNYEAADFRITKGSSLANAGSADELALALGIADVAELRSAADFCGNARFVGSAIDLGAFENQADRSTLLLLR